MNNKKIILTICFLFVLIQIFFIGFLVFREQKTVSLECSASFIRNINDAPDINYAGEMTLMLTKSGKGNLVLDGRTIESEPRTFHLAYFFDYYLDGNDILKAKITSIPSGLTNELPESVFRKQFIGLEFRLKGGLRIHMFKNVYVLSIPGFIVNTCAPVQSGSLQ